MRSQHTTACSWFWRNHRQNADLQGSSLLPDCTGGGPVPGGHHLQASSQGTTQNEQEAGSIVASQHAEPYRDNELGNGSLPWCEAAAAVQSPHACRKGRTGGGLSTWRQTPAPPACRRHVPRAQTASDASRARGAQVKVPGAFLSQALGIKAFVARPHVVCALLCTCTLCYACKANATLACSYRQASGRLWLSVLRECSRQPRLTHTTPSKEGTVTNALQGKTQQGQQVSSPQSLPSTICSCAAVSQSTQCFAGHSRGWRQVQQPPSAAKRSSGPTPSSSRRTCASIDRQGSAELSVKGEPHLPEAGQVECKASVPLKAGAQFSEPEPVCHGGAGPVRVPQAVSAART